MKFVFFNDLLFLTFRKDQVHLQSSDGSEEGDRKTHEGNYGPEPTLEQRIKTEMNWGYL